MSQSSSDNIKIEVDDSFPLMLVSISSLLGALIVVLTLSF